MRLQERKFDGIRLFKVTDTIWELKVTWNKQEFGFLFFYGAGGAINFVNFFQKKARKTPLNEVSLANTRMKELQLDQAVGTRGIPPLVRISSRGFPTKEFRDQFFLSFNANWISLRN